jgi:hypothetical protein
MDQDNHRSEQECCKQEIQNTKESVLQNLRSLNNIIDDITSKLNHQVLGNCDVLCGFEEKTTELNEYADIRSSIGLEERISDLIKRPLKLNLARLNGLKKVVLKISSQVNSM